MRFASDIATALSAATGRSNRPNGWQLVGVCLAYWGSFGASPVRKHDSSQLKRQ